MTDVRPFRIAIPQADLDDLRLRLNNTRWVDRETPDDWNQGVPLAYAKEFCGYWATGYDWRVREARLNSFDQFVTSIDGLDTHFIHARSPHALARPIIMTHGWPGSVVEFVKVIRPLTHPEEHDRQTALLLILGSPSRAKPHGSEKTARPHDNQK